MFWMINLVAFVMMIFATFYLKKKKLGLGKDEYKKMIAISVALALPIMWLALVISLVFVFGLVMIRVLPYEAIYYIYLVANFQLMMAIAAYVLILTLTALEIGKKWWKRYGIIMVLMVLIVLPSTLVMALSLIR